MNFREALTLELFKDRRMRACDNKALELAAMEADELLEQVGDKLNPKPQREIYDEPVYSQALQHEILDLNRRIVGQAETIRSLQTKLQKAQEGWEKAGREAAQHLARAEAAERRLAQVVILGRR